MKGMLVCSLLLIAPVVATASEGLTSALTVTAMPYPPTRLVAERKSDENPRYRTRWAVSLDAAGRVTKLDPADKTLVDAVRIPLDKAIRSWQFIPGTIDGHPAVTETTLALDISLVPFGGDKFALRVDDARTGGDVPLRGIRAAPKYPSAAIRHRRQGMVVLKVDYGADGHVVAARPHESAPAVAAELTKSAEQAVKRWTFSPEVVGGHPLAGSAVVPICFEIVPSGSPMPRTACEWVPPGAHSGLHENDVVAIAPAARLKTDVVGRTL
jgi:TonB family protein